MIYWELCKCLEFCYTKNVICTTQSRILKIHFNFGGASKFQHIIRLKPFHTLRRSFEQEQSLNTSFLFGVGFPVPSTLFSLYPHLSRWHSLLACGELIKIVTTFRLLYVSSFFWNFEPNTLLTSQENYVLITFLVRWVSPVNKYSPFLFLFVIFVGFFHSTNLYVFQHYQTQGLNLQLTRNPF